MKPALIYKWELTPDIPQFIKSACPFNSHAYYFIGISFWGILQSFTSNINISQNKEILVRESVVEEVRTISARMSPCVA